MKDDDIVDSVEEFGFKMFAQHLRYGFAYLFFIVTHGLNLTRTEIRSHDEDGVLKINCPAFRVSLSSVIEELQMHIKNVVVRFFYFTHTRRAEKNELTNRPIWIL